MHFWHFRSTLDIIFSIIVKQQLLPAKLIQLWFLINRALTNVCIIIKPHRSATQMWPIVTDGPAWTASLLGSSALQKRLNWFRCRLGCGFGCAQGTMYYIGKNGRPTVSIRTLCRELCKNGWTNQDAVWDVNSGGPKETSVRLGFKSPHEGAISRTCPEMSSSQYTESDSAAGQQWYGADADWGVLERVYIGTTWQIWLNRPCSG